MKARGIYMDLLFEWLVLSRVDGWMDGCQILCEEPLDKPVAILRNLYEKCFVSEIKHT